MAWKSPATAPEVFRRLVGVAGMVGSVVVAGSAPAGAIQAGSARDSLPAMVVREGKLSFDGRASLGDFTGVTTTVTGATRRAAEVAGVSGWVEAPVRTLVTGNDRRDRDLNKSMESEKHPVIRYELDRVAVRWQRGDSMGVDLHGRLLLHGVTRDAILTARLAAREGGFRLQSDFPVNLKDYRIGGLSKMLGLLKMHEDIVVHVDVLFVPAGPGDRASASRENTDSSVP